MDITRYLLLGKYLLIARRWVGEMKNQVCIIIRVDAVGFECLDRCFNSIQKQTYTNWVCAILDEDRIINQSVNNDVPIISMEVIGEYINNMDADWVLFCKSSSVLAPDLLETLINNVDEGKCVPSSGYMAKNERNVFAEESDGCIKVLPYGKLFSAKNLFDLWDKKDSELNLLLTLQYMDCFETNIRKTDSYIYDLQEIKFVMSENEVLDIACKLAFKYSYLLDVNAWFSENYLSVLWERAVSQNKEDCYQIICQYLNKISGNENLLSIALDTMHITKSQYQCIQKCTFDEFMFYRNRFAILQQNTEIQENVLQVSGYDIAQNTVALYRNGFLGLKTILASLIGWIKYKIGKRGVK